MVDQESLKAPPGEVINGIEGEVDQNTSDSQVLVRNLQCRIFDIMEFH